MKRRRVAVTLSIPYDMAKEYENLARRQTKNKSELFREMFRSYRKETLKEEFYGLQRYGSPLARKDKIITEEDVQRIVFQRRHGR